MKTTLVILICAISSTVLAQQDWWPIPQQSTLILQNQQTNEVIPLKVDSSTNSNEHFVWLKHGSNQGICSSRVLNSRQIITGFTIGDSISMNWDYNGNQHVIATLRIDSQSGAIYTLNDSMLVRNDGVETNAFLGVFDSIMTFSILTKDSTETEAKIELSKHHGIVSFPRYNCLFEACSNNINGSLYESIGISTPFDTIGYELPSRSDFSVVNVGDEILVKSHSSVDQSSYYPPTPSRTCYSTLKVSSINETKDTLDGIVTNYTDNFIHSNSNCLSTELGHFASLNVIPIDMVPGLFGIDKYERIVWVRLFLIDGDEILESRWDGYGCDFSDINGYNEYTRFNTEHGRIRHERRYTINYRDYRTSVQGWVGMKTSSGILGYWPENLGVNDIPEQDCSLWPNPTSGIVQIQTETAVTAAWIFDAYGKKVNAPLQDNTIDLQSQPNGLYLIKLETETGRHTKRLVIQH